MIRIPKPLARCAQCGKRIVTQAEGFFLVACVMGFECVKDEEVIGFEPIQMFQTNSNVSNQFKNFEHEDDVEVRGV